MRNSQIIGICVVVSALILAAAIFLHGRRGRYQLHGVLPPGTLAVIDTSSGVINTIQVGPRPEPPVSSLPPGGMPGLTSPDLGGKSGGAKTPAGETPKKLPKATN